jgi:chemotaxis protein methyltransferase CheR
MTCHEVFSNKPDWDVKILATDLDTNVLRKAKEGVYANDRVERLSKSFLKKYFIRGRGSNSGFVRVSDKVREFITFKHLNLMEAWPMRGKFDAIFCRNVIIYFDKDTQRFLIDRYAELLNDESYLFLGHSESLFKVTDRFKLIGQTIYKKVA